MKQSVAIAAAIAGLIVAGVAGLAGGNGWWKPSVGAQATFPAEVQGVVLEALMGREGEYAAYGTYAVILEEYGERNPFENIMKSERRHIESLEQIPDRYDVPHPLENPYLGLIEGPGNPAEAAQAVADVEIANVALYERQLEEVAEHPDILEVFLNLQAASQQHHLPAFQRAVERYADV